MRERGETKKRKWLVSTVMADERELDRFCLVTHLSSSLPVSLFFKDAPVFVLSFWTHPSVSNAYIIAPHLHPIPTSVGGFPPLLSEFLLIINGFVSHVQSKEYMDTPFKEDKRTHKSKAGKK